jgi:hypothetical protein
VKIWQPRRLCHFKNENLADPTAVPFFKIKIWRIRLKRCGASPTEAAQ